MKLGRPEVGVIVDEGLDLLPSHLGAALVEEIALIFGVVARLADNAGFSAGGVGAHRETRPPVDALGPHFTFCH